MIVTEYMENGSLDAFLRVRLSITTSHTGGVHTRESSLSVESSPLTSLELASHVHGEEVGMRSS